MSRCNFCELPLPQGCCHISGEYDRCQVGPRTDKPWVVGMVVWKNLCDRRGIKRELQNCEIEIQAEIIECIGKLAISAMFLDVNPASTEPVSPQPQD